MKPLRFAGTFAPGFEAAIRLSLREDLPESGDVRLSSGFVRFSFSGIPARTADLSYFNNIFAVFREWDTLSMPFRALVRKTGGEEEFARVWDAVAPRGARSFRVRFSASNRFMPVDKDVSADAERLIASRTGLSIDRVSPDIEFWYLTRSEGWSCLAARLPSHESEIEPRAGELRPEIARLLVAMAAIPANARTLVDPFAGYGSIPEALRRKFPDAAVYALDVDGERAKGLSLRFSPVDRVHVAEADVTRFLDACNLPEGGVDAIVTDPPWGFWEGDRYGEAGSIRSLYDAMLSAFAVALAPSGRLVVLTGAKREFEEAVAASEAFRAESSVSGFRADVLVNGKKSAVYSLSNRREPPQSGS